MPRFAITGPLGPEQIEYPSLLAASPLAALLTLHAEALGDKAVRLEGDRLVFADPAEQDLCAGLWQVAPVPPIGEAVVLEIAPGARRAA